MDSLIGTRLGSYEVVSRLGSGGMGAVYRARDTRLDRVVAIKVVEEQFGERFEQEARAISALNHPHICTLYDVGPNYLVMELKSIGFFASGQLKRIDVSGGVPVTLCEVTSGRGGTWNTDGVIVFNGYNDGPLLRISASGGKPAALTTIDEEQGENSHRFPQFLPDGRRFLFFVRTNDAQTMGIYLGSLDKPGEKVRALTSSTSAWYAPGEDAERGHLLWVRNDRLVAQPFSTATATLSGEAVAIADGPFAGIVGRNFFSASTEGTLLYEKAASRNAQLSWFGRDGKAQGQVGAPDAYRDLKISPDGKRAAIARLGDIWVFDFDRGLPIRLTIDGGANPSWSPDGVRVAFTRGSPPNIFRTTTNESGREERVTNTRHTQTDIDWSPDGRLLLYAELSNEIDSTTKSDIWALPLTGERKPFAVVQGRFQEFRGRFSPDGRWIAYTTDEPGRNEIYVQRLPSGSAKQRVSASGGDLATWRPDGKELLYRSPDGMLMSVPVQPSGDLLVFASASPLLSVPLSYDLSPDGQRVLVASPVEGAEASPLILVTHWRSALAAAAPR